jgi:hypothetical protein
LGALGGALGSSDFSILFGLVESSYYITNGRLYDLGTIL